MTAFYVVRVGTEFVGRWSIGDELSLVPYQRASTFDVREDAERVAAAHGGVVVLSKS